MQLHLIISVLLLLQVPTVNRSVVVTDGLSASPITASAKLTDDHAQLDHLVLTLSNIQHRNDESLRVSQETVGPLRVVSLCSHCTPRAQQYNSTTGILLLQGPAPVSAFEDALNSITYVYTQMERIISFVPDFSPR